MVKSLTAEEEAAIMMDAAAGAPRLNPPTMIIVPQRGSMESLFAYGSGGLGFSPGPMTLVSSFFSDQDPCSFLSQPLSGGIVSPQGKEMGGDTEKDTDASSGYKRNRPASLVVAPPPTAADSLSHLLMIPGGMTPSGLLTSPGFLSPPLQSPFAMSHQQALAFVTAQAAISETSTQMQVHCPQTDNVLASSSVDTTSIVETETLKIESPEIKTAGSAGVGNSGNDGYNWRKYGQKNVKASECPRSYYRCSHMNCPVRKKVEASINGHVSAIIYKGQHNHDPPQPSKRGKDNTQTKSLPHTGIRDSFEKPRSPGHMNESAEPVILSLEEEDELPDAKRRNIELEQPELQTSTEYKIVVQTRSEVDLLDDGYKWRKYGQKTVKGRTFPRSYYKCTYAGCNVRKQIERASSDTKAVTTTYEGKHNHDIPIGKYSTQPDPHHLKPQKTEAQNLSRSRGTDSTGNNHSQPATIYIKDERIAA